MDYYLHCLAFKLLIVSSGHFTFHGRIHFTLCSRVRQIGGGSKDKFARPPADNQKPTKKRNQMNTNQEVTPKPSFPVVPTTKVLAIGQFTAPPTPEQIKEIFPHEVPETLKLYLS